MNGGIVAPEYTNWWQKVSGDIADDKIFGAKAYPLSRDKARFLAPQ